jgi:hypothetical protein
LHALGVPALRKKFHFGLMQVAPVFEQISQLVLVQAEQVEVPAV